MSNDFLFQPGDLGMTLRGLREKLRARVESASEDYLLKVNEAEYIQHITTEFTIDFLVVNDQAEIVSHFEREEERRGHFGPVRVKIPTVDVTLGFTGDAHLLQCSPSGLDMCPPSGRVSGQEITRSFSLGNGLEGAQVRQEIEGWVKAIRERAAHQTSQIKSWNSEVENYAREAVKVRKERLLKKNDLVAAIGLPVRRRDDPHGTYSVPVARKQIRVSAPPTVPAGKFEPHPVMDEMDYLEILSHLRHMSRTIERDPGAFRGYSEEQLRTQFLMHLNGAFEGQGTGESFSHRGKTDIFLRVKERAIFIAECKFWKGAASFQEIIDQLLGYLTWRESKTAILLFVRNADIGAVCQQVPGLVSTHKSFTKREQWGQQGEFRFVLRSARDESLPLVLTTMCFHFPQALEK
jgi:hypothetical protein